MKLLIKHSWAFFLSGCLLLSSCDKTEDDPFTGGDNYITSFILKNGDQTVTAAIDEDKIIVTAPSTFSLTSATAEVTLSENTSIKPDPATINDWSSEYVFVVTAFNGTTKSYTYTISDTESSVPGSIILRTQTEVNAFGESGTTKVEGNLIIGMGAGRDSITSLTALNKIEEVGYGVIIKSTYASETLDGLSSLAKVGGALQIETSRLLEANFPALTNVMDVKITSKTLEKLSCPTLAEVSGGMNFSTTNLSEVDMPVLTMVNGNITFTVPEQNDPSALKHIIFPALKQVDGTFEYRMVKDIESIDLPELITCGAINLGYPGTSASMQSVSLPKLEECKGELRYSNLGKLQHVELPLLQHTGSLIVSGCSNVESFNVPKLKTVDGDLNLGLAASSEDFGVLDALASVGGTFNISFSKATSISTLKLPSTLKSCKALTLFDCATLRHLDITGVEIGELTLERATLLDLTIKGNSTFSGVICLKAATSSNLDSPYSAIYTFPKLDGIREIGGLWVADAQMLHDLKITGISKINGDIRIDDNYAIQTLTIQDLTEVTGNIITASLNGITASDVEFASIQKVGGSIKIANTYTPFSKPTISFPALKEAGQVEVYVADATIENILMPQLSTITDSLKIAWPDPSNTWKGNQSVKNLNGFSALTSVDVVYISKMQALVSYEGLKNCIPSLTKDEQWVMDFNKYQPTLEMMKQGKWNQSGI